MAGKSKDEQLAEKKQELEKRLQDVSGQLGTAKKTTKKGKQSHELVHFSDFGGKHQAHAIYNPDTNQRFNSYHCS